jgi:hypothetical protein
MVATTFSLGCLATLEPSENNMGVRPYVTPDYLYQIDIYGFP